MADKLLPCPHCGGNDITVQPFLGYWAVGCNDCFGAVMGKIRTKEEAIEAWNKRDTWHTGTPTEEGVRYAVICKGWKIPYPRLVFIYEGKFYTLDDSCDFEDFIYEIVAYQKITPYEGEELDG